MALQQTKSSADNEKKGKATIRGETYPQILFDRKKQKA